MPSLDSPVRKTFILCCFATLLIGTIGGLASVAVFWPEWQYPLIASVIFLSAYTGLYLAEKRHIARCQYCHSRLDEVVRPFLLSSRYLALQGVKRGDYFFTYCRWGKLSFRKRWAKISRRSRACHHCRLTEERLTEHYETPTEKELLEITTTGNKL